MCKPHGHMPLLEIPRADVQTAHVISTYSHVFPITSVRASHGTCARLAPKAPPHAQRPACPTVRRLYRASTVLHHMPFHLLAPLVAVFTARLLCSTTCPPIRAHVKVALPSGSLVQWRAGGPLVSQVPCASGGSAGQHSPLAMRLLSSWQLFASS